MVANEKGEIFDLEGFAAVGADGPLLSPMTTGDTIELPHGSELMFLPDRMPVLMDLETGQIETRRPKPLCTGRADLSGSGL